ncbi:MAG: hypothetical protein AB8G99_11930 [Planctomycetaceae bacterium]
MNDSENPSKPGGLSPAESQTGGEPEKSQSALGTGVALGVSLGTALGVATGNLGLWLSIGVAIGCGLGTTFSTKRK